MFKFTPNQKKITDVVRMFKNGELIVDESYQRRSVWNDKDKVCLIETILLNLVMPELFFWPAEVDPDTGKMITHIVDGQQRIKSIVSFALNEFKLEKKYLIDESAKQKFGDKYFRDLTPEEKTLFWGYDLMVIDIDQSADISDIIAMFSRLNLTDYNLNDQEKRNSRAGEFAQLAKEISENLIWDKYGLFRVNEIKRMKDVEFAASLILLSREGIVDQTDQSALNNAYDEFQKNYEDGEHDKEMVLSAISIVDELLYTEGIKKFARKTTQLYTIFCISFFIKRMGIDNLDTCKDNLEKFVELYSKFNNNTDLSSTLNEAEKKLYELLKKHKLASSEGIHKYVNRMIRFNVMKTFMFDLSPDELAVRDSLSQKLSQV